MKALCNFIGHKIVDRDYTRLLFRKRNGGNWRLYKQRLHYTECKRCGAVLHAYEVGKYEPYTECKDKAIEVVRNA